MDEIISGFKSFIELNPHYGYLIAAIGFGIFLIGYIKNWNWVMEPGGGWINIAYWETKLGNKVVRWFMGIISFIGIGTTLLLFAYYQFYA